jgi:hypothetical protein
MGAGLVMEVGMELGPGGTAGNGKATATAANAFTSKVAIPTEGLRHRQLQRPARGSVCD